MRAFVETPNEFFYLNEQAKDLVLKLFKDLKPAATFYKIPADRDLASDDEFKDTLVLIKEGSFTCRRHDRRLFTYEHGDVVGIERLFRPTPGVEISSSFPVTADIYDAATFFKSLAKNPKAMDLWSELLVLNMEMYSSLLSVFTETKLRHIAPREQVFHAGEAIIVEGEKADNVYTLAKGSAKVMVSGKQVGEIKEDEVFGVVAALGETPRTASVVASETCHVLAISKHEFSELIKLRPTTVSKVMQGMARTIADLNKKLTTEENVNVHGG